MTPIFVSRNTRSGLMQTLAVGESFCHHFSETSAHWRVGFEQAAPGKFRLMPQIACAGCAHDFRLC